MPLPVSQAERKADRWRPLMEALEEGEIVSLPFTDRRDLRSKKVVVARLADQAGFTVQSRQDDGHVALRRMDLPHGQVMTERSPQKYTKSTPKRE
jgi:hypothetical protein